MTTSFIRATQIQRLLCCLLLATGCNHSNALAFREDEKSGTIFATGPVEIDDAERLAKILTLDFRQRHHNLRQTVTIRFNSPGGSLLGGIRLGYTLRKLFTHTEVEGGAVCMSACAVAFLGGNSRTVSGQYGVHAASFRLDKSEVSIEDQLDTVQKLGAVLVAYATEMTSSSDAMVRALSTSAASISVLTDKELVSMRVITLARRPSQYGQPGFKCPAKNEFTVLSAICSNLDISRLDSELNDLFKKIQAERHSAALEREQAQWRKYRNSCINSDQPNGYASVVFCVRESYSIRRDQLLSIWLDISTKKTAPGMSDWAEIKP
jgi:hypothetical protein